jgi:hypothetical protein
MWFTSHFHILIQTNKIRSVIDLLYTQVTDGKLERYHHKWSLQLPSAFIAMKEIRQATPKVPVSSKDRVVRIDQPVISPELSKSCFPIFAREMPPKKQAWLGLQKEFAPIIHPDQGPKDFLSPKRFLELDGNLANIYWYVQRCTRGSPNKSGQISTGILLRIIDTCNLHQEIRFDLTLHQLKQ